MSSLAARLVLAAAAAGCEGVSNVQTQVEHAVPPAVKHGIHHRTRLMTPCGPAGTPTTRWATVAFGAGVGLGSAYRDCDDAFRNAKQRPWPPSLS